MIRDTGLRSSAIATGFLGLATVLLPGCATESERAALTQLDDWKARRPVEQVDSVLPSDPGRTGVEPNRSIPATSRRIGPSAGRLPPCYDLRGLAIALAEFFAAVCSTCEGCSKNTEA